MMDIVPRLNTEQGHTCMPTRERIQGPDIDSALFFFCSQALLACLMGEVEVQVQAKGRDLVSFGLWGRTGTGK